MRPDENRHRHDAGRHQESEIEQLRIASSIKPASCQFGAVAAGIQSRASASIKTSKTGAHTVERLMAVTRISLSFSGRIESTASNIEW